MQPFLSLFNGLCKICLSEYLKMNREPEPELMKKKSQVKAYSSADFSSGEINLIKFISNYLYLNNINLSRNDLIVDLGCGPGNISEKLSEKWPDVYVLGIDGSQEMIREAKSRIFKNKTINKYKNLNYLCADIRKISSDDILHKRKISLLVSNSFLHHITDIDNFFKYIINLSNKDTLNFHKDLIRPKDEYTALKLKAKCALKYNSVLTSDYYASLRASYRKNEVQEKILEFNLKSMNVIKESEEYLILYGKV